MLIPGSQDAPGTPDVFLKNRGNGVVTWLSTDAANPAAPGNSDSFAEQISGDGAYVLMRSRATNLIAGFVDGNGSNGYDLFLVELQSGIRTLVSRTSASPSSGGNGSATGAHLSTDGRFVAFNSRASNHVAGSVDAGTDLDVFLFDRTTGQITLVSHATGLPLQGANGASSVLGLSSDGRFTFFTSDANDVMPGIVLDQVYRWDRLDGSLKLVSHAHGHESQAVSSDWAGISADGQRAVFTSRSTTVVHGVVDVNGGDRDDLFVWQAADPAIALISRRFEAPAATGNEYSPYFEAVPEMNGAGTHVLFASIAGDLAPGDGNLQPDLFLAELGSMFADGFESGSTSAWTAATP